MPALMPSMQERSLDTQITGAKLAAIINSDSRQDHGCDEIPNNRQTIVVVPTFFLPGNPIA